MGLDALEGTVILPLVIYDPPPLIQYVQPPSHVAPTTCNEKVSDPFEGTTGFGRMGTRRALLFKALSILRAFSRAIHENHKRRTEATKPTISQTINKSNINCNQPPFIQCPSVHGNSKILTNHLSDFGIGFHLSQSAPPTVTICDSIVIYPLVPSQVSIRD
jgi:hypothetical protein